MAGSRSLVSGALNDLKVRRLTLHGHYCDGNGLYLQVSAAGTKSWCFRYRFGSRRREMGLGPYPTVSLLAARIKALDCRRLLLADQDPLVCRQLEKKKKLLAAAREIDFRACSKQFLANQSDAWKNAKHASQWPSTLQTYVYPMIGHIPVQDIDLDLILKVLEPIWNQKRETASRVRGRVEKILGYATVRGYRDGLNPARWKDNLDVIFPAKLRGRLVNHHRSLPHKEVALFVQALRAQSSISALALELTILTAARTNEVLGAKWAEISVEEKLWRVPAERMKTGKAHEVPLSPQAMDILEKLEAYKRNEFLFPGAAKNKPMSNMAMLTLLKRMKRQDITVHGCRSTFRNWAGENNFQFDASEKALSHTVGNSVSQAYYTSNLTDTRRTLMDAWGRYCSSPAFADPQHNVSQLRRRPKAA